ncbi:hypothetical protein EIP86_004431 [Pleurotus ostreatoroseus]|nr:hypothetical protein EIP86_004431 [Pleurotus ostreatoroseus]
MSSSIAYLTSRANFRQVSPDIPITKQRNQDKVDTPDAFEDNKREMVSDILVKAKQIEYLINSLPQPESEETQAKRLESLEQEMTQANEEYMKAVNRAISDRDEPWTSKHILTSREAVSHPPIPASDVIGAQRDYNFTMPSGVSLSIFVLSAPFYAALSQATVGSMKARTLPSS